MTGFGEARSDSDALSIAVEVRAINNRHLKLSLRASDGYSSLESEIEPLVRQYLRRGVVQMNLRVARKATEDDYRLNQTALASYQRQLAEVSGDANVSIASLLGLPGVVDTSRSGDFDPKKDWELIKPIVVQALETLCEMRLQEGAALGGDLKQNSQSIRQELAGIIERAPNVVEGYRQRLTDRVDRALNELNVTVEPADLIREVALFADRSDISEETVRLASHLDQFDAALSDPAISGRKLEFIVQEMGRETNTIGSKASDTEISKRVVEIKTALERIREQIQNVE